MAAASFNPSAPPNGSSTRCAASPGCDRPASLTNAVSMPTPVSSAAIAVTAKENVRNP
jgi:hypothetical protein